MALYTVWELCGCGLHVTVSVALCVTMCVEMAIACAWLSETDSESGWVLGVCRGPPCGWVLFCVISEHLWGEASVVDVCACVRLCVMSLQVYLRVWPCDCASMCNFLVDYWLSMWCV